MIQPPRTNREADPHSPSNPGLSTALCEVPCLQTLINSMLLTETWAPASCALQNGFFMEKLLGDASGLSPFTVSESPGPTWACLPSPHKLLDPFPKVMLHSIAFSEYGRSPAQCLMIWEVFKEEVGSQILGPRRTSEEVPAVVPVAAHQWRWEKWSDAGLM